MAQNPIVTITMEDGGVIKAELYPEIAPTSVNNFISLINQHFYDGLIFHRVIRGFMIQGGCPESTGAGGPGYSIKGEFAQNGFQNDLKHTTGVLSMARSQNPDSAGSQFFIMHKNAPHLDGSYAAFGKVIEGMDVVNRIAETSTDSYSDRPYENQVMKSVTVEITVLCSQFVYKTFNFFSNPTHDLYISIPYTIIKQRKNIERHSYLFNNKTFS